MRFRGQVDGLLGRLASEITAIEQMQAIWAEHKDNGGDSSYRDLEILFDLREAHGMTAYRICRNYESSSFRKRPAA